MTEPRITRTHYTLQQAAAKREPPVLGAAGFVEELPNMHSDDPEFIPRRKSIGGIRGAEPVLLEQLSLRFVASKLLQIIRLITHFFTTSSRPPHTRKHRTPLAKGTYYDYANNVTWGDIASLVTGLVWEDVADFLYMVI
ncbi:MAG: hypothetical protein Q9218_005985 [Villophora microphyllina]